MLLVLTVRIFGASTKGLCARAVFVLVGTALTQELLRGQSI